MTDQDLDGSHIKGLGINMFHNLWKSIIKLNVIGFMNTPILKAKKGSQEVVFYNDGEYEQWKEENNDGKGWSVKYYKGLGTSTGKEFKEYFEKKKVVTFNFTEETDNIIDLVFNKKRADDRKEWLGQYDRKSYLDTSAQDVTFREFVNKELMHFSKYDCDRSIPNLMDGLKTSLRKILFAGFKKNLTKEIKVAQFSGYVSEHSGYHHGEASLNGAIVGMAQDYVGSNNINLFLPNGQFGTRLLGGKDSASERYIFTELNPITRLLFPKSDDNILEMLDDDGTQVEPIYYAPIIPMILVNGSKGIGTGFSTDVMCYSVEDIIKYIKSYLSNGVAPTDIKVNPYYEGFKGTITPMQMKDGIKYLIKGNYKRLDENTIQIIELPIGTWTTDYKQFLEDLIEGDSKKKSKSKSKSYVKDYIDMSTDRVVDFTVTFKSGILDKLETTIVEYNCTALEKFMKLYTTNTNTNMHMFDADDKLKLYKSAEEIINDYFVKRYAMYEDRKKYLISVLERELCLLSNKARYITENLNDTIDLRRKKKDVIVAMLKEKGYDEIDGDSEYKYLRKMPMDSVSEEEVAKLLKEENDKKMELNIIQKMKIENMWLNDLIELEAGYEKYRKGREALMVANDGKKKGKKKSKKLKLKKSKGKK